MRYDRKSYFAENGDPLVPGFTIIEVGTEKYRVAEKWEHEDGARWVTYWINQDKLHERADDGRCELKGNVSNDQFEAICQKTDERALA